MTLAYHEIISWIITAVSVALFFYERKKNNLMPFYMNLQGILKSCHAKCLFYWGVGQAMEQSINPSDTPEIKVARAYEILRVRSVQSDFESLKQVVMGVMKAIEPNKDMIFDEREYTRIKDLPTKESVSVQKVAA